MTLGGMGLQVTLPIVLYQLMKNEARSLKKQKFPSYRYQFP